MTFAGFPSRAQATAIPNVFFTDVLPRLAGDAVALGVALYAFKALLGEAREPAVRHGGRAWPRMRSLAAFLRRGGRIARRSIGAGSRGRRTRACCCRSWWRTRDGDVSCTSSTRRPIGAGWRRCGAGRSIWDAIVPPEPAAERGAGHLRAVRVAGRHAGAGDRGGTDGGGAALSGGVAGSGVPRGGGAERAELAIRVAHTGTMGIRRTGRCGD